MNLKPLHIEQEKAQIKVLRLRIGSRKITDSKCLPLAGIVLYFHWEYHQSLAPVQTIRH